MNFDIKPASDYSIPDLVEIVNRGFQGYFVPIHLDVTALLNMIRKDGIDLTMSRVQVVDGEPAGMALLARRGWTSRLAAMGIAEESRGRGLGSLFMEQLIEEAHQRGEHEMVLEVIEQNQPAVHLYKKYGFKITRRLIGFIRQDAAENISGDLSEMDLREAGQHITRYGLPDLPWQLSGESIAQLNLPSRAFCDGQAYIVISNPDAKEVVIWSLLVEPNARGNGLGVKMLKSIVAHHPGKTWHVPAILPEELGKVYERAGFEKEKLSQWQMKLTL